MFEHYLCRLIRTMHTGYRTQYHIVWIRRFRQTILVKGLRQCLETKFREVREYYPEWGYIALGIDSDYVHIHMVILTNYAVSEVVDRMKTNTSRALNTNLKHELSRKYFPFE